MSRLLDRYRNEIVPELKKQLGRDNALALPRVEKVTISMGVGKAIENKNRLDAREREGVVLAEHLLELGDDLGPVPFEEPGHVTPSPRE